MDAFRVFDLVFVMTQGGPGDATQVLQFYGYQTLFTEGRIGYGSAISVAVFLMILGLSLIYLRAIGSSLSGARTDMNRRLSSRWHRRRGRLSLSPFYGFCSPH